MWCDLSPGAGCYKTAPLLFRLRLVLAFQAVPNSVPLVGVARSFWCRQAEEKRRGTQSVGWEPARCSSGCSRQHGSAHHAPLQRLPEDLLPQCVWLSLLTRWQVQGPWTSSVPWLLALKLILPLSC